jgi:hypothetical protein
MKTLTRLANITVGGFVVFKFVLTEQACPDRGTPLWPGYIGHNPSLLAGLDILDLEITLVGDGLDCLDADNPKAPGNAGDRGAIVTIDAIGCQREIAKAVLNKKADYVLALKGKQGSLREDVGLFVTEQKTRDFANTQITRETTVNGDHGRIETRTTTVIRTSIGCKNAITGRG